MTYIKKFKDFKEVNEQSVTSAVLNIPEQFKADSDRINQLRDTIGLAEQDLAAKKLQLNNETKQLQEKIGAEQTKQADIQKQEANKGATPGVTPGVQQNIQA
jgi:hypothetical protein